MDKLVSKLSGGSHSKDKEGGSSNDKDYVDKGTYPIPIYPLFNPLRRSLGIKENIYVSIRPRFNWEEIRRWPHQPRRPEGTTDQWEIYGRREEQVWEYDWVSDPYHRSILESIYI